MIASAMSAEAETMLETADSVLDRDHLSRQTFGNRQLEREVLALFDDHARRALSLIKSPRNAKERGEAAHSLVGAARGVGAFRVAAAAARIERGPGDSLAAVAALDAAVADMRRAVARYLSD
jgi:HPt (histidine-containing phosphotransfer) domain-containing protein